MKYGETLEKRSLPEYTPYNVDYNELKHLIKVNTTRDQGQAIAIPGHTDAALQKFEDQFFIELSNQHDRVDLFVKSKADEFSRKLRDYQRRSVNIIARCNAVPTMRRKERYARMESKVSSCGQDIRNLEKFAEAQITAFTKILKKYKKWTGSASLGARFHEEVLSSPKSFVNRDYSNLQKTCDGLLALLHNSTPSASADSTPSPSRRASEAETRHRAEVVRQEAEARTEQQRTHYWNEYDDGSEAGDENEPYTLYIDPADETFPGSKAIVYVLDRAKMPLATIKGWLGPRSRKGERRPLLISHHEVNGGFSHANSTIGTNSDDDASSSDFPAGYETHYATFPSVADQKLAQTSQKLLFRSTIASFFASFILLLIAGILISTGRHRLRVEVDAGVTVGVVAALFFATLGLSIMLCRWQRCGWMQRSIVGVTFIGVCLISAMLLVLVMGNTAG